MDNATFHSNFDAAWTSGVDMGCRHLAVIQKNDNPHERNRMIRALLDKYQAYDKRDCAYAKALGYRVILIGELFDMGENYHE